MEGCAGEAAVRQLSEAGCGGHWRNPLQRNQCKLLAPTCLLSWQLLHFCACILSAFI